MWGSEYGWQGMLWMGLGALFWLVLLALSSWLLVHWLTRKSYPPPDCIRAPLLRILRATDA